MMDSPDPVTHPFVWILGISAVIILLIAVFTCLRRKKKKYKFLGSIDIATVFGQMTEEDNAGIRSNEPDPLLCPSGASCNPAQPVNKREPTASRCSKRTENKSCLVNEQPAANMGGCRQKSKSTFHATFRDFNVETSPENGTASYSKPNRQPRSDYDGIYLKHPKNNPNKSRPLPQIHPSQLILTEEERASLPENALRRLQAQSLKYKQVSNFGVGPANRHQSISTEHAPKNLSKQIYSSWQGNQSNTLPVANLSMMAGRPLPPFQMDGKKPIFLSDKKMKKQETTGEKKTICVKPLRSEQLAVITNDSVGNPAAVKGSPSSKKKKRKKTPKDLSFEFPKKPASYGNARDGNINKRQAKEDSPKTLKLHQDCNSSALETPQQVYALKYRTDNYSDAPKNQQKGYQRSNVLNGISDVAPCSSSLPTTNANEKGATQLTPPSTDKPSPSHLAVEGKSHPPANLFTYFSEDITLPSNELEVDPSAQTDGQPEAHNLMKPNDRTEEDATVQLLTNDSANTRLPVATISPNEQHRGDNSEHVVSIYDSNGQMLKNKGMTHGISSDPHSLGVPKNVLPKDDLSAELENEPEIQLINKSVQETKTPVLQVLKSAPGDPGSLKSLDTIAPLATEEMYDSGNVKPVIQPALKPADNEGKVEKTKDAKPKAKVFSIPRGGNGVLEDFCQL